MNFCLEDYYNDNIISLHSVIDRIDFLESINTLSLEMQEELEILKDLIIRLDYRDSGSLINDNYFTQYITEQIKEDIGSKNWITNFIDYESAANFSKQDYTTVEFKNNTYYYL